MNNFEYVRATAIPDALRAVAAQAGSRFLAGGTTMVDLMKCGVEVPAALIDITRLPGLDTIEAGPARVRIGALSRMSDVADHPIIRKEFPVLSESLWRGASA
ncbi:FAD binding domain-containing protein, partial [Escherichia coli]|uniref:FAD binding domain-containing protein n=1 Tax=Escherichia coli TaxID=562 RepID=UPI003D7861BA